MANQDPYFSITKDNPYTPQGFFPNQEKIEGNIATTPSGARVDIITGELLTPPSAVDFQSSRPIAIPVVPPASELTEPKQKAQAEIENIQSITQKLLGESEFRTGLETIEKLPELRKTGAELAGQLKGLEAEAKIIPLQIQQEFVGRGATEGGIAPIQTGRLRENAIKALTVSALLQANQGQIATALDLVDQAVAAKYDPIKEEIRVRKANLDLILQSPEFTRADKEQAQKQKDAQDEKEKKVKQEEKNYADIQKHAVDAALGGADALTLRNIQKLLENPMAENVIEAARLAAPFLRKKETTPVPEVEIDTFARQVNAGTAKISSIPQNIRSKVVARVRDFAEEDLREDIQIGVDRKIKKDALISQLQGSYPEFSKSEIESIIGEISPAKEEEKIGETTGLFGQVGSFFGSLFR